MIITPNGYELVYKEGYDNTVEKALSNGFEDAMKDKGRECDYDFTIEEKKGVKYIWCEVKLDQGYHLTHSHKAGEKPSKADLNDIERNAYQFLLEKL